MYCLTYLKLQFYRLQAALRSKLRSALRSFRYGADRFERRARYISLSFLLIFLFFTFVFAAVTRSDVVKYNSNIKQPDQVMVTVLDNPKSASYPVTRPVRWNYQGKELYGVASIPGNVAQNAQYQTWVDKSGNLTKPSAPSSPGTTYISIILIGLIFTFVTAIVLYRGLQRYAEKSRTRALENFWPERPLNIIDE